MDHLKHRVRYTGETVSQNVHIHYVAGTGMPNAQFHSDECGSD
jgi:hypothetical protein